MQPDFSGVWRVDFSRSLIHGEPPRAVRMVIDHVGDILRQEVIAHRSTGEESATFVYDISRETTNFLRGIPMVTKQRWEGDILIIEGTIESPAKHLWVKDHWFLAESGKTLIMEHRDDDLAGQRSVMVRD